MLKVVTFGSSSGYRSSNFKEFFNFARWSFTFHLADVKFSFGRWHHGIQCDSHAVCYLNVCFCAGNAHQSELRQFPQFGIGVKNKSALVACCCLRLFC